MGDNSSAASFSFAPNWGKLHEWYCHTEGLCSTLCTPMGHPDGHVWRKGPMQWEVLKEIYMCAFTEELSNQAWKEVWHLDNLSYKMLKAKLVELGTADEKHESMQQKPLLYIYQANQPRYDKDKRKDFGDKRKNCSSKSRNKKTDMDHTCTTKSDKVRALQNNCDTLSGIPQNAIHQHQTGRASCWHCRRNSHHTLECWVKKTSKGTELARPVMAPSELSGLHCVSQFEGYLVLPWQWWFP